MHGNRYGPMCCNKLSMPVIIDLLPDLEAMGKGPR